jgi:putative serine protease PepD
LRTNMTQKVPFEKPTHGVVTLRGLRGGSASGFVIQNLGSLYLLTTGHTLGLGEVSASFLNGFSLGTICVGVSRDIDLAVLSPCIDEIITEISPLELGSSHQLQTGQECYVIGSPFGIEGTFATATILPSRSPDFIRISARVYPGNSGSPLLDESASVVGMIAAGASPGEGLAIPVDRIRTELPLFIDNLKPLQRKC